MLAKSARLHGGQFTASLIRMSAFDIRLATAADAARIAAMSRDHIEHGLGWHYRRDAILAEIADPDANVITAYFEEELAGFAIMRYAGFEAHLVLFAVRPGSRRQGAGTQLIKWLVKTAQVAGAQAVYVELRRNNTIALKFYESLGFTRIESMPGYYRAAEDGVRMALDLRHVPAED